MTALTAVYPKVRIEAPGAPEPLIEDVVADALRDFFRDSECWRHTTTTLLDWSVGVDFPTLTQGVELPANTRLKRIDVVKYGTGGETLRELPFRTRQDWDCTVSNWEQKTATSPYGWTNDPHGAAPRIVPGADATQSGVLQVRSIVVPTSSLTDIDDYFYDEFHDLWRFGALARLLKMPGRDWTNPAMAAFYEAKEEEGVKMAKSRAQAEFGQPTQRIMAYGGI